MSSALFDIFIEGLAQKLAEVIGISYEDILFYVDDILVLCQTQVQLKQCIEIKEEWTKQNGMELNKKKSVILPFGPRGAKDIAFLRLERTYNEENKKVKIKWIPTLNDISGIPTVSVYKYLGTYMEPKLATTTQLENIKKKANFLFVKLYPYLINPSADGRRDMWKTMIVPLFNPVLLMCKFEKSKN